MAYKVGETVHYVGEDGYYRENQKVIIRKILRHEGKYFVQSKAQIKHKKDNTVGYYVGDLDLMPVEKGDKK